MIHLTCLTHFTEILENCNPAKLQHNLFPDLHMLTSNTNTIFLKAPMILMKTFKPLMLLCLHSPFWICGDTDLSCCIYCTDNCMWRAFSLFEYDAISIEEVKMLLS